MDMVVNSVAYQAGKRLSDVTIDDISEVVKEPDTFVWLGVWQPDEAFLRKIQEEFSLHDLAIEDALKAHQRPKIEVYGESLFIVVKTAQLMDGTVQYGETHMFAGKNFLVTVRHGASSSYAAIRSRVEENSKSVTVTVDAGSVVLAEVLPTSWQDPQPQILRQLGGLRPVQSRFFEGASPTLPSICSSVNTLSDGFLLLDSDLPIRSAMSRRGDRIYQGHQVRW
ncbi:CorA family divalent cation transporter [Paraburkholderia sp. RL18-101-BIB-B]|uniref:CorA family divalent cation transporter n=1 Tax=unclassified Paraburkholderia TaxID=2615204 RepID=UPI0038B9180E